MPALRTISLLLLAGFSAAPLHARSPNFKRYPLRLNVLVSRSSSHTPTILLPTVSLSDLAGSGDFSDDGRSGSPGLIPSINLPLYEHPDPVFYGVGRADLFSAGLPRGLNFSYDNCLGLIAVTMPHQPLFARWKKPGRVLELLVPIASRSPNHPQQWDKCRLEVALQDFVYLLLHNGVLVRVAQDGVARKPALLQFTEGLATLPAQRSPAAPPPPAAPITPAVLIHTQ